MAIPLNLPANNWLKREKRVLPHRVYDSAQDFIDEHPAMTTEMQNFITDMEEEVMATSLQFYPRTVQVKDGFIGQLVMNNHIVWESLPQETEEEAEETLGIRIVTAMQTLFEIVPDMTIPSKELNGGDK